MAAARSSFPDLQGTIEDVIVAGDAYVIGRLAWHGTQQGPFAGLPPTHTATRLAATHIVRFEQEKIVEWWGDIFGAVLPMSGQAQPGQGIPSPSIKNERLE
jgi:predicted ester cyclase